MLQLLKESVSSKHAERLEQIVIALIAIEIGRLFSNRTSITVPTGSSCASSYENPPEPRLMLLLIPAVYDL